MHYGGTRIKGSSHFCTKPDKAMKRDLILSIVGIDRLEKTPNRIIKIRH